MDLSIENPETGYIRIVNNGEKNCVFNLHLNDEFYSNIDDLVKKVKSNSIDGGKKPEYFRVWSYLRSNTYTYEGISENSWPGDVILMINSLGFGNSMQLSYSLSKLWEKCGFISQLTSVHNYFYPQVFVKNHWELLDITGGLYFMFDDNNIAGLTEVTKDSMLLDRFVLHPATSMSCTKTKEMLTYHFKNKTTAYHHVLNTFNITDTLTFSIPEGGKIEFPGIFDAKGVTYNNTQIPYFAQLKLTIPKGKGGLVQNPLVIHSIKGKGSIEINKKVFQIGSDELAAEINKNENFILSFKIVSSNDDLEIIYYINPFITKLYKENNLKIDGYYIDRLKITAENLPDTSTVNYYLKKQKFFYHKDRINLYSKCDTFQHPEFNTIDDLINFSSGYFIHVGDTARGNRFVKKMSYLNRALSDNEKKASIIHCIINLPLELILYDFEETEITEIFNKINALGYFW